MQRFQTGRGYVLLGAAGDTATTGAAVVAYFQSNACTQSSIPAVVDFQNAWNAENPDDQLVVDGKYGPLTQGALQNVMGATPVPANCFGGQGAIAPQNTPQNQTVEKQTTGSNPLPWLIGGAIVVTAFAAWTYSGKTHKKRRRHV